MEIQIRRAVPGDEAQISEFNAAMARETEHLELDRGRALEGVRALLADAGKGFYLLAAEGDRIVGQLMITYEWSDWRNGTFWWIQSVYVCPGRRRQGVYRQLYEAVRRMAAEVGDVCGIRLYVEEGNQAAQQVYQRLGMRRCSYEVFEVDFVIRRESSGDRQGAEG